MTGTDSAAFDRQRVLTASSPDERRVLLDTFRVDHDDLRRRLGGG